MTHSHVIRASALDAFRVWDRIAAYVGMIVVLSVLASCGRHYISIERPATWPAGAMQSELYIDDVRTPAYVLYAEEDSLKGRVTGKGGWIVTCYVLAEPPWSDAEATHLIKSAEPWQYPCLPGPRNNLEDVVARMIEVSQWPQRRYIVSVDPLVIAGVGDTYIRGTSDYVYLIDPSTDAMVSKLFILLGEYPEPRDLRVGQVEDEREIQSRTRVVEVGDMTLAEVLESPGLWQSIQ